jgi:hypothetical protein
MEQYLQLNDQQAESNKKIKEFSAELVVDKLVLASINLINCRSSNRSSKTSGSPPWRIVLRTKCSALASV